MGLPRRDQFAAGSVQCELLANNLTQCASRSDLINVETGSRALTLACRLFCPSTERVCRGG